MDSYYPADSSNSWWSGLDRSAVSWQGDGRWHQMSEQQPIAATQQQWQRPGSWEEHGASEWQNGNAKGERKRHPEEDGFHQKIQHLHVRPALLVSSKPHSTFVELGNLLDDEFQHNFTCRGPEEIVASQGYAGFEVLCDERVIFGNPFKQNAYASEAYLLKEKAYKQFLQEAVRPLNYTPHAMLGDLVATVAPNYSVDICQDWLERFGTCTIRDFQQSFECLVEFMRARREARGHQTAGDQDSITRLVCRCAPSSFVQRIQPTGAQYAEHGCHVQALATHLNASIQEQVPVYEAPAPCKPQRGRGARRSGPWKIVDPRRGYYDVGKQIRAEQLAQRPNAMDGQSVGPPWPPWESAPSNTGKSASSCPKAAPPQLGAASSADDSETGLQLGLQPRLAPPPAGQGWKHVDRRVPPTRLADPSVQTRVPNAPASSSSQPSVSAHPERPHADLGGSSQPAAYTPSQSSGKSSGKGRQPRQPAGKPPWGDRWGAAGIVALQRLPHGSRVCLVEKRNGRLGFPKGRAESIDASALDTALREWREEAMLATDQLEGLSEENVFVDGWGCHYFFAEWKDDDAAGGSQLVSQVCSTSWEVKDDPLDNDPIIRAHWMLSQEALGHRSLGNDRKTLLRRAIQGDCLASPSRELPPAPSRQPAERRWKNTSS